MEHINIEDYETKEHLLWWQRRGLSYTAKGCGKKIPTIKMLLYGKRWKRIYCSISSNIITLYIIVKGKQITVRQ